MQIGALLAQALSGISRSVMTNWTVQEWLLNLPLPKERERILEVGSIHLRLKTPAERRRIQKAEEELYNGLRFPIQRIARYPWT